MRLENRKRFHKYLQHDVNKPKLLHLLLDVPPKVSLIRMHKYLALLAAKADHIVLVYMWRASCLRGLHPLLHPITFTFHTHSLKMQAALSFAPTLLPLTPSQNFSPLTSFPPKTSLLAARFAPIKATPVANGNDTNTVDYSSITS